MKSGSNNSSGIFSEFFSNKNNKDKPIKKTQKNNKKEIKDKLNKIKTGAQKNDTDKNTGTDKEHQEIKDKITESPEHPKTMVNTPQENKNDNDHNQKDKKNPIDKIPSFKTETDETKDNIEQADKETKTETSDEHKEAPIEEKKTETVEEPKKEEKTETVEEKKEGQTKIKEKKKETSTDTKPINKKITTTTKKTSDKDDKILLEYEITSDNLTANITILETEDEYIPIYSVEQPKLHEATHAILNHVREEVISMVQLTTSEFIDPKTYSEVKEKFMAKAMEILGQLLPESSEDEKKILVGILIHEMLGLGDIEILLNDNYLEEIVINNCEEPVWVYHKKFGWVKTTINFKNEETIYNYMAAIGRKVGRQITNVHPLMDAHLSTGDRVNATLFPISTKGNTITIRRFSRSPWTIINMIDPKIKTLSIEVAAIIWLSMQFELNILVVGGTASGKTSLLNALIPFIPPNQRILSIEDTREIQLPKYLHWIPFSSREPNPEGQGGVSMLDLLTNALRMRPDRIIVGEIRRAKEAEVMFEAIRTGHSAYATFHSDTADQAYKRLTNPPIDLPEPLISALHLMLIQYRHRRKGIRRNLELAEIIPLEDLSNKVNVIYKWNARDDTFEKVGRYIRLLNELHLSTGMNEIEIEEDLKEKQTILQWMLDYNIKSVNAVGKVFAEYYRDERKIVELAKQNADPSELLGPELMKETKIKD